MKAVLTGNVIYRDHYLFYRGSTLDIGPTRYNNMAGLLHFSYLEPSRHTQLNSAPQPYTSALQYYYGPLRSAPQPFRCGLDVIIIDSCSRPHRHGCILAVVQ